jgi:hypothetical protein
VIVVGIEEEREAVGLGVLVAPGQLPGNPGRLAIEQPGADIERLLVVGDAQLGGFGDRLAFLRLSLRESGDRHRPQPDLVVQHAVDDDRAGRADRVHHGDRPVVRPGLRGRVGGCDHQRAGGERVPAPHRTPPWTMAGRQ